ncbi:DUF2849 domain-containing protein [Phenylobacterium sp.]|jgi:hypothetical protein|uniref:DUF2849 domain-containing protein n=1 Tax=Phenylobacterium sp. TaxID=1871053 RepID=UPI0025FDA056|nr:DUF2849 domain-containing protein [Phenylobacterium sp.]MCA3722222.1 DUF2849 domain-containing protein [Phenylobacterium sp.]
MKALTANRLSDGEVVFWKAGAWVERLAEADVFDDDALATEAETRAKGQPTIVIDPYLIELVESAGFWAPVSYRERIRALGPTNHEHHGKQAEGGGAVEALRQANGAARSSGRVNLIRRK